MRAIAPSKRSLNIKKLITSVPTKKSPRGKKYKALHKTQKAPMAVTALGVNPIRRKNLATGEIIRVTAGFKTSLIIRHIVG
jgi:hypothetical protein